MKYAVVYGLITLGILALAFVLVQFSEERVSYEVSECGMSRFVDNILYDSDSKTLNIYVDTNCCGIKIEVEKTGRSYYLYEKQVGELCRCICKRMVIIKDVPKDFEVFFVRSDGTLEQIKPQKTTMNFCGWSSYGRCKSDLDCVVDGCSAQVCRSVFEDPIVTTCEWKECYNATKFNLACKCVDGICKWS